jgi:hypothetical protein
MFALRAELVEGDEVGMINIGQRAELLLEAVECAGPNCCKVFSATMASCSRSYAS